MEPPTMDELLDEWVDENAPWMAKLMPRRNPSARVLYLLLLHKVLPANMQDLQMLQPLMQQLVQQNIIVGNNSIIIIRMLMEPLINKHQLLLQIIYSKVVV